MPLLFLTLKPLLTPHSHQMFLNGTDYKIARKLKSLDTENILNLQDSDKLEIVRAKIKENLQKSFHFIFISFHFI